MNAGHLARVLRTMGVTITGFEEGDEQLDGSIDVTPLVSIQVATYGRYLGVVLRSVDGNEFTFYPERTAGDLVGLVSDVRDALGMVTS